jgi:protein O-mannosyl-transferase
MNKIAEPNVAAFLLYTLLIGTCILSYWPGLYGPFIEDDLNNLGYLLQSNLRFQDIASSIMSPSGEFGRPIAMLSFSINAVLSQDTFYWKLTNLSIHVICGVLIYFLVKNSLCFVRPNSPNKPILLALTVTSIWLLHPLQVSTVLYTVQRMTQLSALFIFAALLSYLIARKRQLRSESFILYQLLTWCVFFPLAIFSKENGILLPLFILLIEVFLIKKDEISNKLLGQSVVGLATLSIVVLMYKWDWVLGGYANREFTVSERLMTEPRVIMSYLGMLLAPMQSSMTFMHDDFTVSKSLFEPATSFLSLSVMVILIGSAFYFRKKQPIYCFGILFYFAGHLLESTFIPLYLMYEHRNYLPSLGIFLAIFVPLSYFFENKTLSRSLVLFFLALLTVSTWLRVDTWSSEFRFLTNLERFKPKSEQVAYLLSQQATQHGDYQKARLKMKPFNTLGASFWKLTIDCLDQKSLNDSQMLGLVKPFDKVGNYPLNSLVDIANLGLEHKCNFNYSSFISLMDDLLAKPNISPQNRQLIMMYKAHYLWHSNKKNEAVSILKDTHAVDTDNLTPLFLACEWSLDEKLPTMTEICPKVISLGQANPYKFTDLTIKVKNRYDLFSGIKGIKPL